MVCFRKYSEIGKSSSDCVNEVAGIAVAGIVEVRYRYRLLILNQ